ncbi:2Fe-2S iron-sulfur cluster-binding protein [Prosthecodimorpha staleyi]|uniref:(2Fe-2S)-binding protein n=1 Tax=Prosthecodimorpha staleyi TaxID=2840188 RepID=A0A947GBE5_9HYPH|nr:2Fe-2S iron-sulfur cluster-binding protein [Prosthecodimorpha staleyi]MBT9288587.1 (2Fe-2S)-binding protein [Prosthecodimorpha staleyi]
MTATRLPAGGLIDRSRPIAFRFDGMALSGYAGDTLAAALLASDVAVVGRSFKLHRPRGVFGAGIDDPNTTVSRLAPRPATNLRATTTPIEEGAAYRSVGTWPNARRDLGAVAGAFGRLLPAGFYYKTFMAPNWHLFEPFIRAAAGLGRVPEDAWEPVSESRFGDCDLLVVGAGPAGLAAALAGARAGLRTILADDGEWPGGRLLDEGPAARAWIDATVAELDSLHTLRRMPRSTVWGHHEQGFVSLLERAPADAPDLDFRHWKLRAGAIVVAAGAFERSIAFADNDRPGVMLASAAAHYLGRYAVRPGADVLVFANNDAGYGPAFALAAAGAKVRIADARDTIDATLARSAASAGIDLRAGSAVERALGRSRVAGAILKGPGGRIEQVACDLIAVAGGWNPAFHLASHSRRVRSVWNEALATFTAGDCPSDIVVVGAARGSFATEDCVREGWQAAAAIAAGLGRTAGPVAPPEGMEAPVARAVAPLFLVPPAKPGAKLFVDLANDVTTADLGLALREGYRSIELVKRYTTAGMGIDQGKTGNVSVIAVVGALTGAAPGDVGTTTFRPPYAPVEFGAIAGARAEARLYPWRNTPLADWHLAAGAVMYEAGLRWQRPGYYPRAGEDYRAAAAREARVVREAVGVYDGTPLGRFRLKGPDVPALLDLVYVNDFASLAPGRGRYGIMLTDDGLILDDGVTFRLDETHWLLHSSTGAADRVHLHLEQILQVHRPDWRVSLIPVPSQWANATLCGPRARDVLAALQPDFDIAPAALPFMATVEGRVGGLPVRVCRVSWTGELSFELNTPARHAVELWQRIMAAGAPFGITPVGSEANHILRVEAGYISTGHEVDGTADVIDLGLGGMVSKRKTDFIGKRSMELRRRLDPERFELVGLLPADPARLVPEGAPLTPGGAKTDQEGFVSACVASVALGRVVGLGLLKRGRARLGETVHVRVRDEIVPLTVVPPVFHDADRARVKS